MEIIKEGTLEWFEMEIVSKWIRDQKLLKIGNKMALSIMESKEITETERDETLAHMEKAEIAMKEEQEKRLKVLEEKWRQYFPEKESEFSGLVEAFLTRYADKV